MDNVNSLELLGSDSPENKKQIWKNKADNYSQVLFYWENNSKNKSDSDDSSGYLIEVFSPNETKEVIFPECTFSGIALSIKFDLKNVSIDDIGRVTIGNKNIQLSGNVIKGLIDSEIISGTELACLTTGCGTCKAVA